MRLLLILWAIGFSACAGKNEPPESKVHPDTLTEQRQEISNNSDGITTVQEIIPENDFDYYSKKFILKEKDLTELKKWIKQVVKTENEGNPKIMTKECAEYTNDVIENAWGYGESIDDKTLRKKWSTKYDLKYASYGHLFETGNGGWGTKELTDINYLGELNNGDWFKLTIKGGSQENDLSETLLRVVKVIRKNNRYYIDNFLSLSME